MAIVAVLTACSPVDVPKPRTVETIAATASPEQQTMLSPLDTPMPASTVESPLSTPNEVAPTNQLALVDQASEFDASRGGWWSIRMLGPIGQTFIPSFAGLDAVELWIEDQWRAECAGIGPELQLRIRELGIDGPIVGVSLTATQQNCFKGITHFAFPGLVSLTPGKPYLIEVTQTSAANWGVVWQQLPDSYPNGATIVLGKQGSSDLWFRTGLDSSTPPTPAYCVDGLWQRLRRPDGTPFSHQDDCLQAANTGP